MNNTAEVFLWGTRIGIIHQDAGKPYLAFEYDRDFVGSGIELSPFHMPLSNRIYEFPGLVGEAFHGAPGLISDSMPDTFGNRILERWLYSEGKSVVDFNAVERLCFTGNRGMGALEYKPAHRTEKSLNTAPDINAMVEFASDVLSNRNLANTNLQNNVGFSQLVKLGTSAGGARAKAVVARNIKTGELKMSQPEYDDDYEGWIIKFGNVLGNGDRSVKDTVEYTLIEYAYYLMAADCKIQMNECRIFEDGCGRHHFMTKRFDRVKRQKLHMQTLGALAHLDYNIPGLCSYEQAASYIRKLGLNTSDVEQFYRRMVFNVLLVNNDDHVKNISFLMDRYGKWSLAPAYDMTFSYNANNMWLHAHQMLINNKSDNITYDDLIASGKNMGLSRQRCDSVINDVICVANKFSQYFEMAKISEKTCSALMRTIKEKRI